ncbi:putative RNA-directed DNA polymerase from transposon BS [Merluccius polli]|uniref:RNA-directed DNA polymerase from transposon BS n=1 Tax=Merluccius polli TaxID=89951 RepID=A0AA47MI42_MERPO|nr:putative RNA-directed DNA polymerase from transposon BS [Merluccius polli]
MGTSKRLPLWAASTTGDRKDRRKVRKEVRASYKVTCWKRAPFWTLKPVSCMAFALMGAAGTMYALKERPPLTAASWMMSQFPPKRGGVSKKITGLPPDICRDNTEAMQLIITAGCSVNSSPLSALKDITNPFLDPLQFAYRANRSVDDAVNLALHYILQHLDSAGTYARILCVDFSSAFNTIIPALLQEKLSQLSVPDSTCRWITDFLSDRKQRVKLGNHVSDSQSISTGSPQGCVLSPLYPLSLYMNTSCTSSHQSVKLLKFADDTTLIRLISEGDESAYRWEADHLVTWCHQNNLELNALKTVEMVVDFRKNSASPAPIILCDSTIDTVESFRFLGTIISQDLKWELNISSLIKKAQQRMYFLRQLKKFNLPRTMMVHFYSSTIESILTSSITIWYAAATAKDKGRLQRVIRSAEKVIGCNLPSLQDLYTSRTLKIVADPSHPGH